MLEISYAFVAENHRAQVRVRLEDAPHPPHVPPAEKDKALAVPLWTWHAAYSTKGGVGGSESHDPKKTKSDGYATHQLALTAGIDSLRNQYAEAGLAADELEKLLAQV